MREAVALESLVQVRMNVATPDGTIYLGGWSHDLGIRKGPNFDQGMIDSFTPASQTSVSVRAALTAYEPL